MVAQVLAYHEDNGVAQKIKYLVLGGGQSVYISSFGPQVRYEWGENAINALLKEGVGHHGSKFFIVFTHRMFPEDFSLGSCSVIQQRTYTREGRTFVGGFMRVECLEEVREAFREEIGEAAQETVL